MSKKIEVIGLGSGDINNLPLGIYRKLLQASDAVFLRTIDHPVVQTLRDEGVKFKSFDHYYEQSTNFSKVYEQIVKTLLDEAANKTVIYAVPGHPMLAEKTVQLLLAEQDVEVELVGGQSYLDALFTALKIDPIDGFQFVDGTSFDQTHLNYRNHLLFCQVYDRLVASDVKLTLLEDLPADYTIYITDAVGTDEEKIVQLPLEELDRSFEVSNLTTVYVPPVDNKLLNHTFTNLRHVIKTLRGPDGCDWDKKQTHHSLRRYAIEEVYELIDAIDQEDYDCLIEELGDVLLQVMLHSQIGEDDGYFTVNDVIKSITEKMIHRHPHVFSNDPKEAMKTWDELKHEEAKSNDKSILDRIAKQIPSLQKAYELQKEAGKVGFNWTSVEDVWKKYDEELAELQQAIKTNNNIEVEKELGDVLFVLVNIALFYEINPELALNQTNNKFISRFSYVEASLKEKGKKFKDVSLETMDMYWDEAKRKE